MHIFTFLSSVCQHIIVQYELPVNYWELLHFDIQIAERLSYRITDASYRLFDALYITLGMQHIMF